MAVLAGISPQAEKDTKDVNRRTGPILLKLGVLLTFAGIIPVPYIASVRIPSPEAPLHTMRFNVLAAIGFSLMLVGIVVILSERAKQEKGRKMRRHRTSPRDALEKSTSGRRLE